MNSTNLYEPGLRLREQLQLPDDEVHLWRVDLAVLAPDELRWNQVLGPDERDRASRFHFSKDRQFFVATRALLRTILASYLSSEPERLLFGYSTNNKPFLNSPGASGVEFNVSHSGSMALLAFARGRAVGVDVEKVRGDVDHESIARRFFSDHEQAQMAALPPVERCFGFFRCWTRKEAYIKASGMGLSLPLQQFDVSLAPGEENALVATRPDPEEASHWRLCDVSAGDGYSAALCVRGLGWRLKL